jgi:hypothetical protein
MRKRAWLLPGRRGGRPVHLQGAAVGPRRASTFDSNLKAPTTDRREKMRPAAAETKAADRVWTVKVGCAQGAATVSGGHRRRSSAATGGVDGVVGRQIADCRAGQPPRRPARQDDASTRVDKNTGKMAEGEERASQQLRRVFTITASH